MNKLEKGKMLRAIQRKIFIQEHLPLVYAGVLANEVLNHFDERLLEGVKQWLSDSLTPEFEVEGITLEELREGTEASLFGALCMLDVYLKDPGSIRAAVWELPKDEGISHEKE